MKTPSASRILSTGAATLLTGTFIVFALFAAGGRSHGAEITFAAPNEMQAESDVLLSGTSVFANYWGNSLCVVNGLSFAPTTHGGVISPQLQIDGLDTVGLDRFGSRFASYASLPLSYQVMTKSGIWTADGGPATIGLGGLVEGHAYAVQLWASDPAGGASRTLTVSSAVGNSQILKFSTESKAGSPGQYVVGNFTANAATQGLTIAGSATAPSAPATQINALQLRDVTGVWSGAVNGVWDAVTPNFAGGQSFQQAMALTTCVTFEDRDGAGTPVSNRTITIAAGGVSVPEVEVRAASSNYTFQSTDGVGITGGTTVRISAGPPPEFKTTVITFGGANTYTGPTFLNAGTLLVDMLADGGRPSGLGQSSSAAGNVVFNGGTLGYSGPSTGTDRNYEVRGTDAKAIFDVRTTGSTLTLKGSAVYQAEALQVGFSKTGAGALTLVAPLGGKWGQVAASLVTVDNGLLTLGAGGILGDAAKLSIGAPGMLDLHGNDTTFKSVSGAGRITDLTAGPGITTLKITASEFPVAKPAIVESSRTIAVRMAGVIGQLSAESTFTGGITFVAGTASSTSVSVDGGVKRGPSGELMSGPYGLGPIWLGESPADRVFLSLGKEIANPLVVNAETNSGIRVGANGRLSGPVLANDADLRFSASGSPAAVVISGSISSGPKSTGLQTVDVNSGHVAVTLQNETATPNAYTGATVISPLGTLLLGAANQIPDGPGRGDVTIAGNFFLEGFNETINGLSGTGVIDGRSGTPMLTVGAAGSAVSRAFTFSGTLQNSGGALGLSKVGEGTLVLDGMATHSGPTTVEQGTLAVNTELRNSDVLVVNGGTLAGTGRILSTTTLGPRAIVQAGLGGEGSLELASLALAGDATVRVQNLAAYGDAAAFRVWTLASAGHKLDIQVGNMAGITPGTTYRILESVDAVGPDTNFRLQPLPARATGELVFEAQSIGLKVTSIDPIRWAGSGNSAWDTSAQEWRTTNLGFFTNFRNSPGGDAVVFGNASDDARDYTVSLNPRDVTPSDVVFEAEGTQTFVGQYGISGETALTKRGLGTVILNIPNSYSGITKIEQGVLRAGHATALGAASGATVVAAGAALELGGGITVAEPLMLNGSGISGGGALRSIAGDNALTGPMTLAGAGASVQVDAGTLTLKAVAQIIGAGLNLTVGGAGGINIESSMALGTGSLMKTGAGTVSLRGATTYTGSTTIAAGTLEVGGGGVSAQLSGPVVNDGQLILFLEGYATDYGARQISGSGHVTYRSEKPELALGYEYLLDGQNTYSGGTTIRHTAVASAAASALGTGPVEVQEEGSLRLEISTGAKTMANDFLIRGRGTVQAAAVQGALLLGAGMTLEGTITLTGDARLGVLGDSTIAGAITGPYNLELSGNTQPTLTLTGENTYTGATTITNAVLRVGDGGTTGSLSSTAPIFNNRALVVNRGGEIALAQAIHGSGTLEKLGPGTLTLSALSDFTGATTVTAGTLNLTGALMGSAVTVKSGATLEGTGILAKLLTVESGGTLAPGVTVGEIHAEGGVLFQPGSQLRFELSGADTTAGGGVNDLVTVAGPLMLDGSLIVEETVPGSFFTAEYGDRWTLFTYSGPLIDYGLELGSGLALSGDLRFVIDVATPHEIALIVVPEPASAGLLGLGVLGWAVRRRRAGHQEVERG